MMIRTQVQSTGIERARALLSNIDGGAEKAIKSAMNRSVQSLRTRSVRAVRERYDIAAGAVRAKNNIRVRYSYSGGGVQANVYFSGQKIPLYRYGKAAPKAPTPDTGRWVTLFKGGRFMRVHPGKAARGHLLKSTGAARFDQAFTARMKSGHVGIFERTGTGDNDIQELMGLSVPQMIGNEEVLQKLSDETYEKFDERIDHEIVRILNGWGR